MVGVRVMAVLLAENRHKINLISLSDCVSDEMSKIESKKEDCSVRRGLIFDSGVGGLSVTAAIRARLPELALDYVADDAFRPYGAKTAAQLKERLPELLWTLCQMLKSDFIVLACNTASTTALPAIRAVVDVPVIGVVPAIKPAAIASQTRHIGVLGTHGTVKRAYVDQLIKDHAGNCRVYLKGSNALVAEAEAKLGGAGVDMQLLKAELSSFIDQSPPIDQIVLACTHFPLLRAELSTIVGSDVNWVDSGDAIARRVQTIIQDKAVAHSRADHAQLAFTTGKDTGPQRQTIFNDYGFERLISLKR